MTESEGPWRLPATIGRFLGTAASSPVEGGESRARVTRWVRGSDVFFLKRTTGNARHGTELREELERLSWLRGRLQVPEVVMWVPGEPGQSDWLLTRALPGIDAATAAANGLEAETILRALAEGLVSIHAIEATDCPFDHDARAEVARAAANVAAGVVDETDFDEERRGWSSREVLDAVRRSLPPAAPALRLTHGDYCLPNVMIHRDRFGGVLDVGRAGRGDPFRDYALVLRSARSRLGREGAHRLEALLPHGATSDAARSAFYRLLDELF